MEDPLLAPAGLSGKFDPEQLVELMRPRGDLLDTIRTVVARKFGLPARFNFKRADRHSHIAFSREVAMYLSYELSGLSYPSLGLIFRRNHSTVIHAHRVVARRMEQSRQFAAMIEELKRKCR